MDGTCICTNLPQAAAFGTAYRDKPSGLKATVFWLLREVEAAGKVTLSDLAQIVGLDRNTLGRNLRVLEKQALGQEAKAEYGLITLSPKGRAARVQWPRLCTETKP